MKKIMIYDQFTQLKAKYEDIQHVFISGTLSDGSRQVTLNLIGGQTITLRVEKDDYLGVW